MSKLSDVTIRAHAMRLADTLSRIDTPNQTKWNKESAQRKAKYIALPPSLADWPEIDVDGLLPENADKYVLVDNGLEPAIWPVDVAVAYPFEGGVRLGLLRTVAPKTLRGLARRVSRFNAHGCNLDIANGTVVGWGGDYVGRFDQQWISLTAGGSYYAGGATENMKVNAPSAMIGIALRHRYEWSAVFSFPSGIKLRFGCDARGALQLFKDRDKPAEGRRRSLLHWVRRHWRKTSSADEARRVRQHLRGVTEITWRGMTVSVIPAEYEVESVYG